MLWLHSISLCYHISEGPLFSVWLHASVSSIESRSDIHKQCEHTHLALSAHSLFQQDLNGGQRPWNDQSGFGAVCLLCRDSIMLGPIPARSSLACLKIMIAWTAPLSFLYDVCNGYLGNTSSMILLQNNKLEGMLSSKAARISSFVWNTIPS